MMMFVWKSVPDVTDRYHSNGGVMIVAENENSIARVWKEYVDSRDHDWMGPIRNSLPDYDMSYTLAEPEPEQVIVFPNAGCC